MTWCDHFIFSLKFEFRVKIKFYQQWFYQDQWLTFSDLLITNSRPFIAINGPLFLRSENPSLTLQRFIFFDLYFLKQINNTNGLFVNKIMRKNH
jgi:hypothetical protein